MGLIGVGLMGQGIGENLLKKGHELTVVAHRNRGPVEALVAMGARKTETAREVAEASEIIIICVTASPQFKAVADGKNGLMAAMGPGKTVIDCTTGEPGIVMTLPWRARRSRRARAGSTRWSARRPKFSPCLVTGAAGVVGEAISRRFAAMDCRLILVDILADRIAQLAPELGAAALAMDISNETAVRRSRQPRGRIPKC